MAKHKECLDCYWNNNFPRDHCMLLLMKFPLDEKKIKTMNKKGKSKLKDIVDKLVKLSPAEVDIASAEDN